MTKDKLAAAWLEENADRLFLCSICNAPKYLSHSHFDNMRTLMWYLDQRPLDTSQNDPYTLLVNLPEDHELRCEEEGETDIRHLGRWLYFEYYCKTCGTKFVLLPPDYPYCGANSTWTCDACAGVMVLCSPEPVAGKPKKCMTTKIRNCM